MEPSITVASQATNAEAGTSLSTTAEGDTDPSSVGSSVPRTSQTPAHTSSSEVGTV